MIALALESTAIEVSPGTAIVMLLYKLQMKLHCRVCASFLYQNLLI
jgi:hypothetical protein